MGVFVTDVKLPFVANNENTPVVSVEVPLKSGDTSLVELADWTVSHIDNESETCVLSCSLSVDSGKLYKMKEVPVVQVEIKTKDGLHSHKHAVRLDSGT